MKEHTLCLAQSLQLWEQGDFDELLRECRTIQSMLTATRKVSNEQLSKTFASLIFRGKVNATLCLLDDQLSAGVLPLDDEVYQDLRRKHPAAKKGGLFHHAALSPINVIPTINVILTISVINFNYKCNNPTHHKCNKLNNHKCNKA